MGGKRQLPGVYFDLLPLSKKQTPQNLQSLFSLFREAIYNKTVQQCYCFIKCCRKTLTHFNKCSGEIVYCTYLQSWTSWPLTSLPHTNLRSAQSYFHLHWGRRVTENTAHYHLAQVYLFLKKKKMNKKK